MAFESRQTPASTAPGTASTACVMGSARWGEGAEPLWRVIAVWLRDVLAVHGAVMVVVQLLS